jgi:vancomycin resistance protein VanJ
MIRRILSICFGIACTVLAVSALIWRSADFFGRASGYVTLGYALAPWAALAAGALFVFALLLKKAAAAQVMLFAIIMWASSFFVQLLPRDVAKANGAPKLRVMTFNTWLERDSVDQSRTAQVAGLIRTEQPDVILLQEISEANLNRLRAALDDLYGDEPLRVTGSYSGFAVLSRFPLEPIDTDFEPTRRMRVVADTPSGPVEIWNVHAYRENLLGGNNALSYRSLSVHHSLLDQTVWLSQGVGASGAPLLIGGDFNMPTFAPAYRALTNNLLDAHLAAGQGMGFTFPASASHIRIQPLMGLDLNLSSPLRLTRIDHLFVNRQFVVLAARTLDDAAGSDHAPIVVDLQFARIDSANSP